MKSTKPLLNLAVKYSPFHVVPYFFPSSTEGCAPSLQVFTPCPAAAHHHTCGFSVPPPGAKSQEVIEEAPSGRCRSLHVVSMRQSCHDGNVSFDTQGRKIQQAWFEQGRC